MMRFVTLLIAIGGLLPQGATASQESPPLVSLNSPSQPATEASSSSDNQPNQTPTEDSGQVQEVIVTARKRDETIMDVPVSVTAFSATTLQQLNVRSFTDYATKTPNVSFSYGIGEGVNGLSGTRSVSIRGISGANTTGVYLDDTPIPASVDPRVVDIDRIEILKGPQGTLFGQNSIGGTLHLITVQPSDTDRNAYFSARMGDTSGAGSPDYSANFASNQTLVPDALTVRAVGFFDHTGGFITQTYPNSTGGTVSDGNQGASRTYGGSLSLLWTATERLSATMRLMGQNTKTTGWPAPFAPLPAFGVVSLINNRSANVPESANDRWYLSTLSVKYKGDAYSVVSSTSYFDRQVFDVENGSEGTNWYVQNVLGYPVSQSTPYRWTETTPERSVTNETRISFDKTHGFSGIAGIYVSKFYLNIIDGPTYLPPYLVDAGITRGPNYCPGGTTTCPSYGSNLAWYSALPTTYRDQALFGELYYDWGPIELTAGARYHGNRQNGSTLLEGGTFPGYSLATLPEGNQHGVVPKVAVTYKFDPQTMVYASAAQGFRAGGAGLPLPNTCELPPGSYVTLGQPTRYNSDSVWNYEIGGKMEFAEHRLLLTGALFQMNWNNIQQQVLIPVCAIPVTVNEGSARARGGELELSGHATENLEFRAGLAYDDAVITAQGPGTLPIGSRVAQVPKATANLSGTYRHPITATLSGFLTTDWSYVGSSDSYTSGLGHPLARPSYRLLNASIGVSWMKSELSLYAANITNQHPNFGEMIPIAFFRHDGTGPDAPELPRVVTLQPFNAGLQFRHRF